MTSKDEDAIRAQLPSDGPEAAPDLAALALQWSRELEQLSTPSDRAHQHESGAAQVRAAIEGDAAGAWDFARTWLRRLGDDIANRRLTTPLPRQLVGAARELVNQLLARHAEELSLLSEQAADPMGIVRSSPKTAGVLRDLGRTLGALRGSGILQDQDGDLLQQLLKFDEELRRSSRRAAGTVPENLRITREQLLSWMDSGAGYDLPGLVRRLVIETSDALELVHFPMGVGATAGAWDGTVRAAVGNAFVPEGLSVWELSAEKNSHTKAESDYAKRAQAPAGYMPADVTYVELICRPWTKAREFADERTADGHWREVRAYNVDAIETWLEHAPSTTVWLAELLGRGVSGVRTDEQWWHDWLQSTRIPLTSDVVLAGRDADSQTLLARLGTPGTTTIGGDVRLEEVLAFVAASLAAQPDDSVTRRVLFLSETDDARRLLERPGALLAVVPSRAFARTLPRSGHHLIIPTPGLDDADLVLSPINSRVAAERLESAGLGHKEAQELGTLARRSLLALRRRLALKPALHAPDWAQPGADGMRRRVLLAHAWNQTWSGDCEELEVLIGEPYPVIEDAMRALAAGPEDPMVAIVDERWHVVSPMDTWLLLGAQISTADLLALREHVLRVMLAPDPLSDLSEEDRLRASLEGTHRRRYSGEIVRGCAHALALLGTVDGVVRVAGGQTGGMIAGSIVMDLLDAANQADAAATWIRLSPHLPLLAEAAPRAVLDALRTAVEPGASFGESVFRDKEKGRFGSPPPSPHTHVLWTLETLVWSGEYFDAAVMLLARLAELDPGGGWSNRPSASLESIFCPWHPNTSAGVEQRIATANRLRQQHSAVAWKLLLSMLPSNRGFQTIHNGPTYREWKVSEPVVLQADFKRIVDFACEALLDDVADDGPRWRALVEHLADMPPTYRDRARNQLADLATSGRIDGGDREALWSDLRKTIAHHREFSDAQWALPTAEVNALEQIAELLEPASSGHRHAWLFGDGLITLGDMQRRDNFEAYNAEVMARRTRAVEEILQETGLSGVMEFAREVEVPGQVGAALARASREVYEGQLIGLLGDSESALVNLAFGYFGARFAESRWEWLDPFLDTHHSQPAPVLATVLRAAWDPVAAGSRADALGAAVAEEFWSKVSYFGLGEYGDYVPAFSARLVQYGRPAAALDLLALYGRRIDASPAYSEAVLTAFEALMQNPEDPELGQLQQYDVELLLKIVANNRQLLGLDRAIQIEWFFLPMLGYNPDAPTLHHALAEDPGFFVEMLSMVFRPRNAEGDRAPLTEQEKRAAENAYRLLSSWKICPGVSADGSVSLEALRSWVGRARELLEQRDRVEIGDQQIGQALAAAPAAEDGLWPCEPVRMLLEELQNDQIDRGLELRLFNNRGVTSRSLDEGGRQEWNLASNYRSQADQLVQRWPRVAAVLRSLADTYEADARREDAQADRRSRGLDD